MKCENCNVRGFFHADLYCKRCPDKPKPKTKTGRAYLFRLGRQDPICSVDVEAPVGSEYEVSAVELMSKFRIQFVEAG